MKSLEGKKNKKRPLDNDSDDDFDIDEAILLALSGGSSNKKKIDQSLKEY
jgi:hypothetical protein